MAKITEIKFDNGAVRKFDESGEIKISCLGEYPWTRVAYVERGGGGGGIEVERLTVPFMACASCPDPELCRSKTVCHGR